MASSTGKLFFIWLLAMTCAFLLGIVARSNTFVDRSLSLTVDNQGIPVADPHPEALYRLMLQKTSGTFCSNGIMREYYRKLDYFPAGGEWIATSGSSSETFSPALCRFRWADPPPDRIRQGLAKKKISSILVMGDAKLHKLYLNLVRFFSQGDATSCVTARQEKVLQHGFVIDGEYFMDEYDKMDKQVSKRVRGRLLGMRRPCNTCRGRKDTCRADGKNAAALTLHYAPIFSVDTKAGRATEEAANSTLAYQTSTFLADFITRLLSGSDPDLIILSPSYQYLQADRVNSALSSFASLFQRNMPATTHVYWLPPWGDTNQNATLNATSDAGKHSQSTQGINRELFQALRRPLLIEPLHRYGFFDLWEMFETWHQKKHEGGEPSDGWYRALVGMLLQLMATED